MTTPITIMITATIMRTGMAITTIPTGITTTMSRATWDAPSRSGSG
jgi:hypothetical protein